MLNCQMSEDNRSGLEAVFLPKCSMNHIKCEHSWYGTDTKITFSPQNFLRVIFTQY